MSDGGGVDPAARALSAKFFSLWQMSASVSLFESSLVALIDEHKASPELLRRALNVRPTTDDPDRSLLLPTVCLSLAPRDPDALLRIARVLVKAGADPEAFDPRSFPEGWKIPLPCYRRNLFRWKNRLCFRISVV